MEDGFQPHRAGGLGSLVLAPLSVYPEGAAGLKKRYELSIYQR